MKRSAKIFFGRASAVIFLAACLTQISVLVSKGDIVFSDNFNRASLTGGSFTYTTTVSPTTTASPAINDGGASIISTDILQLSNDATAAVNGNGRVYVTTPTSAFASPYHQQLNQNPGLVTWTFNMQQIRTDPSGFNSSSYGVALVLGSTSSDFLSAAATGYAVVLGNSGATDPVRLVRFTGVGPSSPPYGLSRDSHLTDIISPLTGPLADIGKDFLSLQVTYNPSGDLWSLSGRNDGATAFADPLSPLSGSLTLSGTGTDSTYTGSSLTHLGVLWNYNTAANQTALFDNFSLTAVPEPSTWGVISGVALAGVFGLNVWRERRSARQTLSV